MAGIGNFELHHAFSHARRSRPGAGVVRAGMLADLIIVPENPVANLKVLYGTGAVRLNDRTGKSERVGGIKYTIKDGIVYDARQLLADGKGVGRRFDFLMQEFNREANTLCSKSGDVALTRVGLDLKVAIDQLREQVQNVE